MSPCIASLDPATRALLARYGFDEATFEQLRERLASGRAEEADNRLAGSLAPPEPDDLLALAPLGSAARARLTSRGLEELARGGVAAVILAGGMATRFGGVVKAGVEVLDGQSFLDLKLRDIARVAEHAGASIPVALMTSFATEAEVERLAKLRSTRRVPVETFPQFISLRLRADGELFRDHAGAVSPYAPGHGDLTFALRRSGLLARLQKQGVRHLFMSNVDNLAATLDPAVIGAHLERARAITFEVAALRPGDKGGVPARLDGRLQVIEALRYPAGFVESSIPWFSTNSFVLELAQIDRDFPLSWYRVTKQVEGRPAIQFERLVNELTAFLPAGALAIERSGADGRFLPVKDPAELRTHLPEIRAVLSARGALS
jgi:UTP--glucose-1-phosphate uridylyltransferase